MSQHFYIDAESPSWMSAADILEALAERGLRGNPRSNQMMVASALRRLGIRKGRTLIDGQRQYGYWGLSWKYTQTEERAAREADGRPVVDQGAWKRALDAVYED